MNNSLTPPPNGDSSPAAPVRLRPLRRGVHVRDGGGVLAVLVCQSAGGVARAGGGGGERCLCPKCLARGGRAARRGSRAMVRGGWEADHVIETDVSALLARHAQQTVS